MNACTELNQKRDGPHECDKAGKVRSGQGI